MESRRAFLGRCGAGAAVWTALGAGGWSGFSAVAAAFDPGQLSELAAFAMERAKAAGASYADIRINRYRSQDVSLRVQADRATGKPVEVPSVSDAGSFGFGLRVLAEGAWGFSASHEVTREAIARAAAEAVEIARANAPLRREAIQLAATPTYRDTYRTKVVTDPFSVPIEQKLETLRAAAGQAQDRGRLFGGRVDRRSARGPVLRLVRGKRDRAARLSNLARHHRDGRAGGPQGQIAHLSAARSLRRV